MFSLCAGYAQKKATAQPTLTLAGLFNSNISYYGQVTTEKYPYLLLNANYKLSSGLYFSAGGYKLLQGDSGISETDLGLGYDHNFTEKLTAGIAYRHSFFKKDSPLLQAANTDNVSLSVENDWAVFKTSIMADYAFGRQQDFFLSLSNSREFIFGQLFDSKDQVSLEPAIELVGGTYRFFDTYVEKINNGKGKGAGNGKTRIVEVPDSGFSPLSYNLRLPLNYYRGNYLAEASYQVSVLGKKPEEIKPVQSFFGLAFYYQF
ncbi:hypothetical protein [Pedobacter yulinensis]|uniref:hypothetical protein n=1 Tax=Pedobacter yulinensis TaxID=2126353 RepID=UPI000D16A21D|nr:hypothetical protein [Pedobacter yulinensis]